MDQAVLSIEAAGGAAQWRDLIASLSPNVTIGICLGKPTGGWQSRMPLTRTMIAIEQGCGMKPRLVKLALHEEVGQNVRPVLEKALEEGFNAVVLLARDEVEMEKWGVEGHCQHLIVRVDAQEAYEDGGNGREQEGGRAWVGGFTCRHALFLGEISLSALEEQNEKHM